MGLSQLYNYSWVCLQSTAQMSKKFFFQKVFQVWVSFWKFCFWESFWDERVDIGMKWWLYHDAMMVGREQRWLHLVWVCGKKMSGCVGIALCYSKQNHSWPSIPYHIIPTTRHHKIQHNSIWYQVGVWASCHNYTPIALEPSRHVGVWEIMSPTYLQPRSGLHSSPCQADSIFDIIWSNFQPWIFDLFMFSPDICQFQSIFSSTLVIPFIKHGHKQNVTSHHFWLV